MQQYERNPDSQVPSGSKLQTPVTFSGLIQFIILIVAVIGLVLRLKEE